MFPATRFFLLSAGRLFLFLAIGYDGFAEASPSDQQPIARGYVTNRLPAALPVPVDMLGPGEQRTNFQFLCEAIGENYAQFKMKSIDWKGVMLRYERRLNSGTNTADFYRLMFELMAELKDTHSQLQNYRPPQCTNAPGLQLDLIEGKPIVVGVREGSEAAQRDIKVGTELLGIDGMSPEAMMERVRPLLHGFSSERAFRREACRELLFGEKNSGVAVTLRDPGGLVRTLELKRAFEPGQASALYPGPSNLARQHFVHYGHLASGIGYIKIDSFLEKEPIDNEFDRALAELREAPGLVLDLRDNRGGYGHDRIVGRFLQKPSLCAIGYVITGAGSNSANLRRYDSTLPPTGPWQYQGPVALLVNDVTGSASDLLACWLRSAKRVTTIGSTTHGILSGTAVFAVLPCGLVARISNGYVCDASGEPIEGNGNIPDIKVEPTLESFLAGRDPALECAVSNLTTRLHAPGN